MKRLIIFDCFGVVFDEIAVKFFNTHFDEKQAAVLKDKFFKPADLGEIEYDEIFDLMSSELNWDKQELLKEWNSLFHVKKEMIPVIQKARKKADVVLLSNAPKGLVERLFEENNLTELFYQMTISANVKMAKPDLEIYRYCVNKTGKKYDEIYMIDDSEANLRNLKSIGIIPVLFKNAEQLESLIDSIN